MKSSFSLHNRTGKLFSCLSIFAAINLFFVHPGNAQTRRYVKPGGNGTGTVSWDNASGDLQATIQSSAVGDEVWVMKGNYQPSTGSAFSMAPGVRIYGSFSGTETNLADRVIGTSAADSSRLVGNGNSVVANTSNGLSNTALLDGFFITGGLAPKGGGMINNNSSPTINRCIFSGNKAAGTAQVYTTGAYGGGIYNMGNASPVLTNCVFWANAAGTFSSQAIGGAICNENYSGHCIIYNCLFSGNSAKGSTINEGGGIALLGGTSQIVNCSFVGNTSGWGGGILYASASPSSIVNCSFSVNSDGLYYQGGGTATLNLSNCIIWGNNLGIGSSNAGAGSIVVANSIVQGGNAGTGNLNVNPLFVGQAAGDLRLQAASPAINKGNNSVVPAASTIDLAGNARIANSTVDMGAYEYQAAPSAPGLSGDNKMVTMMLSANGTGTFLSDANGLIASVTGDGTASSIAGNVTAKVWVEPAVPSFAGQPYVGRHYEITPPVNTATATVTLYFSQQDFTDFNNSVGGGLKLPVNPADAEGYKTNLRISKYTRSSSDGSGLMDTYHNGVTIINPDDAAIIWNGNYWAVSFPVSGFSGFFVQTSQNALPVKWISSNAQVNSQGNAVVTWKVQEQNVNGYEIQKSSDGIHFVKAGNKASAGDGENNYQYVETGIFTGTAFYRIRQVDKDGKTGYSSILKLEANNTSKAAVVVYPNPVNESTAFGISNARSEKISWQLTDSRGVILLQRRVQVNSGNNNIPINIGTQPAGIYYLKITGETINKQIKLVKQ